MAFLDWLLRVGVPLVMLLSPVAMVVCFRLWVPVDVAPEKVKRRKYLTVALWSGTIVALVGFGVARMLLPWNLAMQVMYLFFPLWFGLAMPLLYLTHSRLFTTHPPNQPVRSATLRPRELDNPIPAAAWLLPWAIWAAGLGLLVWLFFTVEPRNPLAVKIAIAIQGSLILLPILGPYGIRGLLREPEPLADSSPSELLARYRSVRRFRAFGMFVLLCLMLAGHSTLFAASGWGVPGETVGRWGATIGLVVGSLGAVIGVIAGLRLGRIYANVWPSSQDSSKLA